MSIKDLFGKSFKSYQSASANVESSRFVTEEVVNRDTYIPDIDFSSASNFVVYGSAELYYKNSISRIYDNYPYDGSAKEKVLFNLSSSYLDRWVLNDKYPKSTGYVILGTTGYNSTIVDGYGQTTTPEYIRTWGGLHTASTNTNTLDSLFAKSAKYDISLNRTQNWRLDLVSGSTIEFWMKKDSFNLSNSEREVILDLWNGEVSSSSNYGRLTLELTGGTGACFIATLQSGTSGFYRHRVSSTAITTSTLGSWNHYGISFISASTGITSRFYKNGFEEHTTTTGTAFGEINGRIDGYIGALQTSPSGSSAIPYSGKLSASVDEFRFWKTRRTSNEIELNWFCNVDGGANSDDETSNNDLGVYYRFNEGIVGQASVDKTVLDYSGRLANGHWQGYSLSSQRNTGSAFVSSSHNLTEAGDPIIYETHPSVSSLYTTMASSGSLYDNQQGNSLFNTLPQWVQDEDVQSDSNLKFVTQILSSYLDTLHSQITALSNLKNKKYIQDGNKPIPFAESLLTDKGFITKDIFVDPQIVELFANKDNKAISYEKDLNEIKNLIYTNIYNNLEKIYKSKGTESSIRNLIRCFGVDDEIVKLNVYTDGGTHYFSDKAKGTSVKKKYINFDDPEYFSSTLYQTSSATNSLTFISGSVSSNNGSRNALTLEADIVVPYKREVSEMGFYNTPFLSSSIFGFHEAIEGAPSNYTWATSTTASLSVYLVRDERESKRAKFVVQSQDNTVSLTSNYVENIYDNTHWNLALRIKPDTYPYAGNVTNTTPNYTIEFYAVNYNFGEIENEIALSKSISNISGSAFLSNPKRIYAGAHRTNFTGSVLQSSDMQVGSVRSWLDYLENDTIKQHNLDPMNYGNKETHRGSNIFTINNKQIPTQELSILNWDFDTVTGSNSSGQFIVDDITSGSTDTIYGWIDNVIRREYRGRGDNFGTSKTSFIENEFLYAQRKELPEISFTNDNIYIKGDRDKFFIKDEDTSDNFYMVEKSLNQVVSEEMLNLFSTIQEFSNLIARPVDRYRHNYKRLENVRQYFFDRIESDTDPEKFINYYRWIDASISKMIMQLVPATVNFGEGVFDVIESHILERNKYQRRPGLLDTIESTEGSLRGIEELTYNWKTGHASTKENSNCLWQKQRKERTDIPDRDRLRKVLENDNNASAPNLATETKVVYQGSTYAIRKLSTPYKFSAGFNNSIHGGVNYNQQKNRDFYRTTIGVHGPMSTVGAPRNVIGIGIGKTDGINDRQKCDDVVDPNDKYYYDATVQVGRFTADAQGLLPHDDSSSYGYRIKASNWWPFNLKSGSVSTGYNQLISNSYTQNPLVVVNLHSDTVDITNEIPMQGPFTQAHIGGHQGRHVNLNKHDTTLVTEGGGQPVNNIDDKYTRPEAYRLLVGDNPFNTFTPDGALGITGPDYGLPYPNTTREWAIYYREERAKRPINIKNIQTTTGSTVHGNYTKTYEVLSTFGSQKLYFRRQEGNLLPVKISQGLPATTNPITLIGQEPYVSGNIFGGGAYSNRAPDVDANRVVQKIPNPTNIFSPSVIQNRFSAPGGPEVMSPGYRDVATGEYSVYNAITYRNLAVRGSGSGEAGTIRVNSHANRREGLRTLQTRHCGKFGIDSQHATVSENNYNTEASFHKQHRNTLITPRLTSNLVRNSIQNPSNSTSGSYLSNDSVFDFPNSGPISFSFWFKPDNATRPSPEAILFTTHTPSPSQENIGINTTNQELHFQARVDTGGGGTAPFRSWKTGGISWEVKWYFITITWSGNWSDFPKFYIDGVSQTSIAGSVAGNPEGVLNRFPTTHLKLLGWTSTTEAQASMANFAIWKSELDSIQVNQLQSQNGRALAADFAGQLIDYWELGTESTVSSLSVGASITNGTKVISQIGKNDLTVGNSILASAGPYSVPVAVDTRVYDNMNFSSILPRSDFQYSWINNSISGSNWLASQKVRGYAPKSGEIRLVGGGASTTVQSAITFPTASTLYGE